MATVGTRISTVATPCLTWRIYSRLGPDVTCVRVFGGLHDLVLSAPGVREPLYKYIFGWLAKKLPEEKRAE